MTRFQAARAALVALSALSMIWTTPALAADYAVNTSSIYAKKNPNEIPTNPNVPNPGPIFQVGPADLKVDYISQTSNNGSYQWTYHLTNVGTGTAHNVKVMKNAIRNDFHGNIQSEITWETVGTVAPGALKTITMSCAPKWQQPPCSASSSVKASSTTADANADNDWDRSD